MFANNFWQEWSKYPVDCKISCYLFIIEKIKTGEGFINDDDVLILLKRYGIWETIPIKTRSLFTNNSSFAGMRVNGGKITNIYQRQGYRWSDNLRKIPMRLVEKITHDINDLLEDE